MHVSAKSRPLGGIMTSHQAIIWTIADIIWTKSLGTNCDFEWKATIFIEEHQFQNSICVIIMLS